MFVYLEVVGWVQWGMPLYPLISMEPTLNLTLSELKSLMVKSWTPEECSTFLLCLVSDLIDEYPDTPKTFVADLSEELKQLFYEACTEGE